MNKTSNVIVKNQFTNTNYSKNGSTPAQFVTEYTSRDDATLTVYPVSRQDGSQIHPFDSDSKLRKSIEKLELENKKMAIVPMSKWGQTTSLEGRAFDQNSLSVSADRLIEKADMIQAAFENHHTIHKLVVSFSTEYLVQNNLLRLDQFKYHQSLKPAVDELKLRDAVQKGCQYLAEKSGYVLPEIIGSIQLDQMHAHAHIVMCETAPEILSNSRRWYDGREYGTFTQSQLDKFRDKIEHQIEVTKHLPYMSSHQHLDYEDHLQEYEKQYANLDIVRDLMLSSAQIVPSTELLEFEKYGDKLLTDDTSRLKPSVISKDLSLFDIERSKFTRKQNVVEELSSRNDVDSRRVEQAISSQLSKQSEFSQMSPFLSAQLFDVNALKKRKTKVSKLMRRVKEVHKERKLLTQRFKTSTDGYMFFKRLEQEFEATNKPIETELIRSKILPYYENRCGRDAIYLDQNSVMQFQPIETPSLEQKESFEKYEAAVVSAKSPLDLYVSKRDYFMEGVKHFNNGYLHADDFNQIVVATKDNRFVTTQYLPELRPTGTFDSDYIQTLSSVDSPLAKTVERMSVDFAVDGLAELISTIEDEPYYDESLSVDLRDYLKEIEAIQLELSSSNLSENMLPDTSDLTSKRTFDMNGVIVHPTDSASDMALELVNMDDIENMGDDITSNIKEPHEVVVGLTYERAVDVAETVVSMVD